MPPVHHSRSFRHESLNPAQDSPSVRKCQVGTPFTEEKNWSKPSDTSSQPGPSRLSSKCVQVHLRPRQTEANPGFPSLPLHHDGTVSRETGQQGPNRRCILTKPKTMRTVSDRPDLSESQKYEKGTFLADGSGPEIGREQCES